MLKVFTAVFAASVLASPVFAGALILEASDAKTNPEAMKSNAVVVARTTACQSPEKTVVTATAEGLVGGEHKTIPLKVINLSTPGTYAVRHEWPADGLWTVTMIAKNPEYKNYATGIAIPIRNDSFNQQEVKHFTFKPDTLE